jgi:hypothetical protein
MFSFLSLQTPDIDSPPMHKRATLKPANRVNGLFNVVYLDQLSFSQPSVLPTIKAPSLSLCPYSLKTVCLFPLPRCFTCSHLFSGRRTAFMVRIRKQCCVDMPTPSLSLESALELFLPCSNRGNLNMPQPLLSSETQDTEEQEGVRRTECCTVNHHHSENSIHFSPTVTLKNLNYYLSPQSWCRIVLVG